MALVDYPSSSSSNGDDDNVSPALEQTSLKRKRSSYPPTYIQEAPAAANDLPPLPPAFHDLYASAARTSTQDDPSLHGGRKRAMPHVEGSWPSHVYLEWYPSSTESKYLSRLVSAVESHLDRSSSSQKLHSLLQTDLAASKPLHISLSQPLNLDTNQRQEFLESLTSAIRGPSDSISKARRASARESPHRPQRVGPFNASLTFLDWAPNDARTRWFLILRVDRSQDDKLNRLLSACNRVSRDIGLGELYAEVPKKGGSQKQTPRRRDPKQRNIAEEDDRDRIDATHRFHFSVAWMLEEPRDAASTERLADLEGEDQVLKDAMDWLRGVDLRFDAVKVKIGNEITSIKLSDTMEDKGKGILG